MTANEPVRVAILGAGSWAISNHLPILRRRADVKVVSALTKADAGRFRLLREEFGVGVVTDDVEEALARRPDAVIVASPGGLHYDHARAALEAGAHVLCEKPFTIIPEEAWALDDLARHLDRHLLLAFGWNYRPIVREAKSLMVEHGVGRIEHVMVAMASGTRALLTQTGAYRGAAASAEPDAATWTEPLLSGGGYAPAQLSHAMGLALWLTGDRVSEVFAVMNSLGGQVDVHDAVTVRYQSGATGVVSGASCPAAANAIEAPNEPWPRHQLQVRIYGSEGQLILDLERDFLWLFRDDGMDRKVDLPANAGLYQCDGPPETLIDLALGLDVPNDSPAELGARTVEFVASAEDSAASGRPITPTTFTHEGGSNQTGH